MPKHQSTATEQPLVIHEGEVTTGAYSFTPTAPVAAAISPVALSLTQPQVQRLSALLAYNLQSPEDLIARVARCTTISVDGMEITLSDGLRTRLKSRALSQWGSKWMSETITRLLHAFVGW